jgi:hypothetical protein
MMKVPTLRVPMLKVPRLRIVGIATAMVVCSGSAFAQMGGGGQPTNPGAGTGGINNPNAPVNPGINDGLRDNFPTTVTRGDPSAGGNQIPLPRTPSANDADDERR